MSKKGLFDDVPISNPDRDKAWAAFIKRRDVKAMMKSGEEFKFPLDNSYGMWCICWEKAWLRGFQAAWKEKNSES